MKILAVEDEVILLKHLTGRLHEALPEAEILAFDNADDVLAVLPETKADIAFLDIAIGDMNGVALAKQLKAENPRCDIVFCTGYSDYAISAFHLGASDYLMKPITADKIKHALSHLRHHHALDLMGEGVYIRCFGEFEVFDHGEPMMTLTKRAKELLAYLVDKAGAVCTSADINHHLFRNSSESYLRVVKKDLIKCLSDIGRDDILIQGWGKLGVNRDQVRCDYFDYLDGNPVAVNQFKGDYMRQYPWAAATLSRLMKGDGSHDEG